MGLGFTHLHLHTQYSLLDGAIRLSDLFPAVLDRGMRAVAITDHGNMYGAVSFFKGAKAAGVKPIFGCEAYVSAGDMRDKSSRETFHLVLLARNEIGYRNLRYLVSMAFLEGFYYHPRIDLELLAEHSEGLVGMSACLSGQVPRTILRRGMDEALEVARRYKSIFEPGMFFLELQSNGLPEQEKVNAGLIEIARAEDIPLVATNDCHYVDRKDAFAQEVLMCIQQGRTLQDEKRLKHDSDEYYIKTPEEMEAAFRHVPEALENAERIAEMCNVELELGKTYLPKFEPPDGSTVEEYLRRQASEGLQRRLEQIRARGREVDVTEYQSRLERELAVIEKMGFPGYFLIVADFVGYAKSEGIPVGPGRGSGAGSLVAYCLGITDLDPLEHGLLFERFLNPERVSMPDFDIDFCKNRRDEVLAYVVRKYGENHVAQIVTHSTLKARGLVRDVARVMGLPYSEADTVAKLVPEHQGGTVTVSSALEEEPKLKKLYDEDETIHKLLDLAMGLEGLCRHAGMHAAGIVIADKPLWEYVPLSRGQPGQVVKLVTQFAKDEVEQVGLVKFDFLGLKTLTIISETLKRINQLREAEGRPPFDLSSIPLDDPEVYAMLQRGDTAGVFQMESEGFTKMVRDLKPDRFSDIVAAQALFRPGPMGGGVVDAFIARKHGREKVTYPHPALESILKETYGVMIYQEQVMQAASALAGFSLGRADIMRRAMGKKKPELLAAQRADFVKGAVERGVPEKTAVEVFDLIEKFAGYGFNKSHSACYAMVTYQTAYLKCHFPVEYVAGLLTCERDNTDKMVEYLRMARDMGVSVLPPDINESDVDFTVVKTPSGERVVRFGLGAIKGVGEAAVGAILEARRDGPFENLWDLLERVNPKKVNKGILEALIKAGALDSLARAEGVHRAQMTAVLETAIGLAQREWKDRASGQTNLFARLAPAQQRPNIKYPQVDPWYPLEQLNYEREAVGFYISGHPLERYEQDIRRFATHSTSNAWKAIGNSRHEGVFIAGMVTRFEQRRSKEGALYAKFLLEDPEGRIPVFVPAKLYANLENILPTPEPVLVEGTVRVDRRAEERRREEASEAGGQDGSPPRVELFAREIQLLRELRAASWSELTIQVEDRELDEPLLNRLAGILRESSGGSCSVRLLLRNQRWEAELSLPETVKVTVSDQLISRIDGLFGRPVVSLGSRNRSASPRTEQPR